MARVGANDTAVLILDNGSTAYQFPVAVGPVFIVLAGGENGFERGEDSGPSCVLRIRSVSVSSIAAALSGTARERGRGKRQRSARTIVVQRLCKLDQRVIAEGVSTEAAVEEWRGTMSADGTRNSGETEKTKRSENTHR